MNLWNKIVNEKLDIVAFLLLALFALAIILMIVGLTAVTIGDLRDKHRKNKDCRNGKHTYVGGLCSNCGVRAPEHTHTFVKSDCTCTICGAVVHKFVNHKCQRCGKYNHTHNFSSKNDRCIICGVLSSSHRHVFVNTCKCEKCGEYIHTYENGKCRKCGSSDPAHIHEYENGRCVICKDIDPKHEHVNEVDIYGRKLCVCRICGAEMHEFSKLNRHFHCICINCYRSFHQFENSKCIRCGSIDPEHEHVYFNEICTLCGEINPNHLHRYAKGKCIICGAIDPNHAHFLSDPNRCYGKCHICGKYISFEHTYINGRCTVCGDIDPHHQHIGGCGDKQCICKICGKEIHRYVGRTCTVCGKTENRYSKISTSEKHPCTGYPSNCSNCDYCPYD